MALTFEDWNNQKVTVIDYENIWNLIYPVGTFYWTSNSSDDFSKILVAPKSLTLTWEWIRVSGYMYAYDPNDTLMKNWLAKSKVIPDRSYNLTAGEFYNSNGIHISESNLPSHNHTMQHTHDIGTLNLRGKTTITNHWRGTPEAEGAFTAEFIEKRKGYEGSGHDEYWRNSFEAQGHWEGQLGGSTSNTTGYTGSGSDIYWLPPMTAAYCWRRIR